ncbi:MAG: SNF2-related protein, partial [Verrucomicrobia bacterium]|nr:SNF2-related protein [Verrucomicrobiota bacterium]
HWLRAQKPAPAPPPSGSPAVASSHALRARKPSSLLRDPAGEQAQLFLILPPNLDQAVARGKVMLVFEAKWSGGRCPLNALPRARTFAFSPSDEAVLNQIETLAEGETPAVLQLEVKDFAALLPLLDAHPNISLGKASAVTVTKSPFKLPLRATLEANGEIVLALKDKTAALIRIGAWVWQNNTLQPLGLVPGIGDIFQGPVRVPHAQVPQFLSQHWPLLQATEGMEANFKLDDFTLEPQAPRFLLELRGGMAQLTALLQCAYGSRIMTVGVTAADETVWLPDPEVSTRYSTRDLDAERAALARLQRHGFSGPAGKLQLLGQNAVLNFFAREYPKLQREWSVTLEERLERSTSENLDRIEPQFRIASGVQWFDLGVVFASSGGETFAAADIQRLLLSGQSHTRLKNGKLAVIDTGAVEELQEVLLDCAPQQHAEGYRINNTQAGFLEATLRQHADWRVQAPPSWRDRAARQSGEAKLECPPLGDLEQVLRPYQKHGVAWLLFLRDNGFGGILADEMGLGKTLQALALLRQVRSAECGVRYEPPPAPTAIPHSALRTPHLVVCPTSLVFNWVAEARKFTPELKVLALQGPDRHERFDQIVMRSVTAAWSLTPWSSTKPSISRTGKPRMRRR